MGLKYLILIEKNTLISKKIYLYKNRISNHNILSDSYKEFLKYCYQEVKLRHNKLLELRKFNEMEKFNTGIKIFYENLGRFLLILMHIDIEIFKINLLDLNLKDYDYYNLIEMASLSRMKICAININEITMDLKECNYNVFNMETTTEIFDNGYNNFFIQ